MLGDVLNHFTSSRNLKSQFDSLNVDKKAVLAMKRLEKDDYDIANMHLN